MAKKSPPHPEPFLEVRVQKLAPLPGLTALCAGYEGGEWRSKQLAKHLLRWLPDFALRETEREGLSSANAVELLAKAARSIYTAPKYKNRGEIGEILLHIAARQVFKSVPAISKFYYKDAHNDTVKGFDAVHVVATKTTFELWLGEVKFYDEIGRAIRDVVKELNEHVERYYLRGEFAAITNKIDDSWPHAKRLRKLIDEETSLDEIFDAVCIPVLLTYNSKAIAGHNRVSEEYKKHFTTEVERHHTAFCSRSLPKTVRIHLLLVPLQEKAKLTREFDEVLRKCQEIG